MKNLVQIKNKEVVTTSRQVADVFEKKHKVVLEAIDILKGDIGVAEKWANLFCETTYIHEQNKQEYRQYLINRDGFTLLAMGFTGKKALRWKVKYIQAFNQMEEMIKEQSLPKLDSKFLLQLSEEMAEKEKQIEEMKPKALFAEAVETSQTSILIGEMAKLLKQNGVDIGQNRMFEWLRDNNYLIKRKGEDYNTPTQYAMERGWFETKVRTINNPDGSIRVTKTAKVTGKGQIYFMNRFLEDKQLSIS